MFSNEFHDDNYDGVVLKIPSWFIDMNELDPSMKELLEKLQSCSKSKFYPDHLKNINELSEYKTKKQQIETRKKQQDELLRKAQDAFQRVTSGVDYELEWVTERSVFDDVERITFPVDDFNFNEKDVFTKNGIRSEFEKKFKERIKTVEDLKNFARDNSNNNGMLYHHLKGATEETFNISSLSLYQSGIFLLGLTYERLMIKNEWKPMKRSNNRWSYHKSPLILEEDGTYSFNRFLKNEYIKLDGYVRSGMKLIKKGE